MAVEWQGNHKLLDKTAEKQGFEAELSRLGYDATDFLVEVRRQPGIAGSEENLRYTVYVTQLGVDHETLVLEGGHGKQWIAEFAQGVRNRHR